MRRKNLTDRRRGVTMNKKLSILIIVALVTALTSLGAGQVEAQYSPELIAEYPRAGSASGPTSDPPAVSIIFVLAGGHQGFGGITACVWNIDAQAIIGCDEMWQDPGSIDFDQSNSAEFNELETVLTDGVDDRLFAGVISVDEFGVLTSPTGGVAYSESWVFRNVEGDTDLVGFVIDFVRLNVNNVTITHSEGSTTVEYDVVWEFWGGLDLGAKGEIDDGIETIELVAKEVVKEETTGVEKKKVAAKKLKTASALMKEAADSFKPDDPERLIAVAKFYKKSKDTMVKLREAVEEGKITNTDILKKLKDTGVTKILEPAESVAKTAIDDAIEESGDPSYIDDAERKLIDARREKEAALKEYEDSLEQADRKTSELLRKTKKCVKKVKEAHLLAVEAVK